MRLPPSARLAAWAVAALLAATSALADDLQDANKLFKQGQQAQALDKVNAYLSGKPKDAQARFLKGLILTEQGKTQEAIKVFTALSEDYPELPEPYNNLAVLYAGQGQYDKAKVALEMAIRTHPSYATAHENLGDVYAKMATQAYDRALQLDKGNVTAQSKLELIKDLFSSPPRGPRPATAKPAAPTALAQAPTAPGAAAPKPAAPAQPPPAPVAPAAPAASPAPAAKPVTTAPPSATPPTVPATAKPAAPATPAAPAAKPAEPAPKVAEKPAEKPDATPAGSDSEDIEKTVADWAKAWSDRNVGNYLSHYAKDFRTPGGEPRSAWELARRERITAPKSIQVGVSNLKVKVTDPGHATVSFVQSYKSDALKSSAAKTLVMVKSSGRWLIQQESVAR